MRYELLGHRVRVYAVSITLLGILVSAAVLLRAEASASSTSSTSSTAAVVLLVDDSREVAER